MTTLDMVKRLMDYGFHPPTIYFPLVVPGAIMIEPTETESKEDIDLFIECHESDRCKEASRKSGPSAARKHPKSPEEDDWMKLPPPANRV